MNLYLIGYRGTGKSTLGRKLADALARPFIDMDDVIAAEAGCSIAELVRMKGWDHFREREHLVLKCLAAGRNQVVSTGGGVVLRPDNVALLQSGTVVWLRARPETIRRRLSGDPRSTGLRPALTGLDPAAEIDTTLAARTPLYQSAMHLVVDTDDRGIEALCDHIVALLAPAAD